MLDFKRQLLLGSRLIRCQIEILKEMEVVKANKINAELARLKDIYLERFLSLASQSFLFLTYFLISKQNFKFLKYKYQNGQITTKVLSSCSQYCEA